MNTYGYVGGNPVSSIDPYGLSDFSACPGCLFPPNLWSDIAEYLPGVYLGVNVQASVPLASGNAGSRAIFGTDESSNCCGNSCCNESFVAVSDTTINLTTASMGASAGRGFEGGFIFANVDDFLNSYQTSIDSPYGGVCFYINNDTLEFTGIGLQTPSVGLSLTTHNINVEGHPNPVMPSKSFRPIGGPYKHELFTNEKSGCGCQ